MTVSMSGPADRDARIRREAMAWLTVRTNDGCEPITSQELGEFVLDGLPYRLIDPQRGIRKPRDMRTALSIRTVYATSEAARPYDDAVGPDGLLRYKWRGLDSAHPDNRALRAAMEEEAPLIWFVGVGPAVYQPIFPVFVLREERERHQFVLDLDVVRELAPTGSVEGQLRRYVVRETRQRLHQPVFRATVLRAYQKRCAVCFLGHSELLDAAHIVPDSEEAGIASVRNGMAMCKIHHAAFDRRILGIRPDLVVEIRSDLLVEIDGPMLQHGLKERHGQRLMSVPQRRAERPDPDLLDQSYARFRSAG